MASAMAQEDRRENGSDRRSIAVAVAGVLAVFAGFVWPGPALYGTEDIKRADLLLRSPEDFGNPDGAFLAAGVPRERAVVATVIATWAAPLRLRDDCPVRVVMTVPKGPWHLLEVMRVTGQRTRNAADASVTIDATPGAERAVHVSFVGERTDQAAVAQLLAGEGRVTVQRRCDGHPGEVATSHYRVRRFVGTPDDPPR